MNDLPRLLLPTPTTSDTNGAGAHGDGGTDLRTTVALLPTPQAHDATKGKTSEQVAAMRAREHGVANLNETVENLPPTPRATDGTKGGPNQRGSSGDLMLPSAVRLLPTPTAVNRDRDEEDIARRRVERATKGLNLDEVRPTEFGQYAPAIARWEAVLGRTAPAPTEPNAAGNQRLSARFVEWMMGLPEGHVVDVPGITRNQALKALGNGVVPQQAAHAIRRILAAQEVAA